MVQAVTGNRHQNEKGFTLIEVLIALAVFSIGILAVGGLQLSSINGNTRANRLSNAGNLALSKVEHLKQASWDSITDESIEQEGAFWFRRVVHDNMPLSPWPTRPDGSPGPYERSKTISVIVYGDAAGEQEIVKFTFIRVRVI